MSARTRAHVWVFLRFPLSRSHAPFSLCPSVSLSDVLLLLCVCSVPPPCLSLGGHFKAGALRGGGGAQGLSCIAIPHACSAHITCRHLLSLPRTQRAWYPHLYILFIGPSFRYIVYWTLICYAKPRKAEEKKKSASKIKTPVKNLGLYDGGRPTAVKTLGTQIAHIYEAKVPPFSRRSARIMVPTAAPCCHRAHSRELLALCQPVHCRSPWW